VSSWRYSSGCNRMTTQRRGPAASVAVVATPLSLLAMPAHYLEPHLLTLWLLVPLIVVALIPTESDHSNPDHATRVDMHRRDN
jgi:hypothetical protein